MSNFTKKATLLIGIGIAAGAAGYLATRHKGNPERPMIVCVDSKGREVMRVNSENEVTAMQNGPSDEPITCKPQYGWFQEPETMTLPIPPTPQKSVTTINGKPIVFDEHGCPPEGYITPGGHPHVTIDGKEIPASCFEKATP